MKIAVTGGIASGKSEVMQLLRDMGKTTVDADKINAKLLDSKPYIDKIRTLFPQTVTAGKVNKKALSEIVFNNPDKLAELNAVAHPAIINILNNIKGDIFAEVPLLVESGMQHCFDKVVVVTAPLETRLDRVKARDGIEKEFAMKIVSSQATDEQRLKHAEKPADGQRFFQRHRRLAHSVRHAHRHDRKRTRCALLVKRQQDRLFG